MSVNEKQVGGDHYKSAIQHWDYVIANELDYFQAQITKYVTRWNKKGGLSDLEKAKHFLEKYIEVEKTKYDKMIKEISEEALSGSLKRRSDIVQEYRPFGYDAKTEGYGEKAAEGIFPQKK